MFKPPLIGTIFPLVYMVPLLQRIHAPGCYGDYFYTIPFALFPIPLDAGLLFTGKIY